MHFFAVSAPGLEGVVERELAELGVAPQVESGGVAWEGDLRSLYQANLWLRAASRVLVRVATFRARSFIELERHLRRIEWGEFTSAGVSTSFRVSSRKSRLYHQRAIEERFAREFTSATGGAVLSRGAPQVDEAEDDTDEAGEEQLFIVRFHRDTCTVSADSSGALLHRRGYRQAVARAPLRETLAAALLQSSGWRPSEPLLDPFCGSGTIPLEAALIAADIAPGLASADRTPRSFAFTRWPRFDPAQWDRVVAEAGARVRDPSRAAIRGSDRDEGAVAAARANAARAGLLERVTFELQPLSASPPPSGGWIVTNPPYGHRVGEERPLRDLYATLGRQVRETPDCRLAMISASPTLERQLSLPLEERLTTRNGGLPVRFVATPSPC